MRKGKINITRIKIWLLCAAELFLFLCMQIIVHNPQADTVNLFLWLFAFVIIIFYLLLELCTHYESSSVSKQLSSIASFLSGNIFLFVGTLFFTENGEISLLIPAGSVFLLLPAILIALPV